MCAMDSNTLSILAFYGDPLAGFGFSNGQVTSVNGTVTANQRLAFNLAYAASTRFKYFILGRTYDSIIEVVCFQIQSYQLLYMRQRNIYIFVTTVGFDKVFCNCSN